MTQASDPAELVAMRDVVKAYQALRPLRIRELTVYDGQQITLLGFDAPAAEVCVGLLTGALLPDSGEIRLLEQPTHAVSDSEAWLAMLDGVGIVTERAVLIDQFTAEQNMALPFTLDLDPLAPDVRSQVTRLAREIGLDESLWTTAVGRGGPEAQLRVRLGRALALGPRLLLMEHPTASLPRDAVKRVATDIKRIVGARRLATLTLTADAEFAHALGGTVFRHEAATGALKAPSVWRKLLGG